MGKLVAVLAGAAVAVAALGPAGGAATGQRVTVEMTEFAFAVKPKTVQKGIVTFAVSNTGAIAHDFRIAGKKTPVLAAGKRGTLRVTLTRPGRYTFVCTLPSHAAAGMKGVLVVR